MNAPLRRVAIGVIALFLVLLVNANVIQVVDARSYLRDPHNGRLLIDDYQRQRGDIIVDGQAIARSVATKDRLKYLRTYPGGALFATLTGFFSFDIGSADIERSQDSILSGNDARILSPINRLSQLLTGRTVVGGSVTLTVDRALQTVAAQALGNRKGAVVALDPRTGAVLALVSSPSYDPNPLSSHDTSVIQRAFDALRRDPADPLLDRATQQTYPPGSTFKVITAAAALSSGRFHPDTVVPAPNQLPLPGTHVALKNFGGETCGNGHGVTVAEALRISCNTAYAGIGLALGADALRAQAHAFGLGRAQDVFGLPVATSVFPDQVNRPQTALSAIGQYDVRVTPLQMAMVAAAIGNGGVEMRPYVVADTRGPSLNVIDTAAPSVFSRAVSPDVAAQLTAMMVSVVASGTGTAAQIPGVAVAGKTGTAQNQPGQAPHAWFIGFAPAVAPTIAVAVLVEHGGGELSATGGAVAAPIAQRVLAAALAEHL